MRRSQPHQASALQCPAMMDYNPEPWAEINPLTPRLLVAPDILPQQLDRKLRHQWVWPAWSWQAEGQAGEHVDRVVTIDFGDQEKGSLFVGFGK